MSAAFAGLAIAVLLFALLAAIHQSDLDSLGDWVIVTSPVIAPVICTLLSLFRIAAKSRWIVVSGYSWSSL